MEAREYFSVRGCFRGTFFKRSFPGRPTHPSWWITRSGQHHRWLIICAPAMPADWPTVHGRKKTLINDSLRRPFLRTKCGVYALTALRHLTSTTHHHHQRNLSLMASAVNQFRLGNAFLFKFDGLRVHSHGLKLTRHEVIGFKQVYCITRVSCHLTKFLLIFELNCWNYRCAVMSRVGRVIKPT